MNGGIRGKLPTTAARVASIAQGGDAQIRVCGPGTAARALRPGSRRRRAARADPADAAVYRPAGGITAFAIDDGRRR
jgi:hypothetical protein